MSQRLLAIALVAGLLLAPGCITMYGDEEVNARVLVTREVGTERIADENLTLREGSSAMDALRAVAEVQTSHGGGFVEAIDGIESRYPDRKVDWFYHVNTTLAGVGAAQYTVHDGDLILFDYRSWDRLMHLDHVLTGLEAWPEEPSEAEFDAEAFHELQADEETRGELYARVNGSTLTVLDAEGEPATELQPPWVLAHAVDGPGEDPRVVWVASDEPARGLADRLEQVRPTGVGAAVTPNATLEVPAG